MVKCFIKIQTVWYSLHSSLVLNSLQNLANEEGGRLANRRSLLLLFFPKKIFALYQLYVPGTVLDMREPQDQKETGDFLEQTQKAFS